MIRDQCLTAVIPARGGSKGIPGKNLYRINGETLVERAIHLARDSGRVERIFVSTDDPEIYQIAQSLGSAPPCLRPTNLASDDARTIDAVHHLIQDTGIKEGYLLLLQPTSPLRTVEDLRRVCTQFEVNDDAQAIVSVVPHNAPHPDKIMKIDNQYLVSYLGKESSVPRQSLPTVYALNGAFYLTSYAIVMEQKTFLPDRTIAYEMPPERSINLDSPLDVLLLESLLKVQEKNHS